MSRSATHRANTAGRTMSAALIMGATLGALLFSTAATADAAPVDRTPVCEYEDGSSQARCVWDARHNGNGRGMSYVITNGGEDNAAIRYVGHKRAHWLATTAN